MAMGSEVDDAKEAAARAACEHLEDGMVVGLGTGSTAAFAVKRVAERVEEGLDVRGVPTSVETMELARHLGVELTTLDDVEAVDVTIDGADEVTPDRQLIKGLGGALLREKIVASVTDRQVIIVDERKLVDRLGSRAPLPVEVLRFGRRPVSRHLREMGFAPQLREDEDGAPFLTDNGNLVLDLPLDEVEDPHELEAAIDRVPGVVENGLFLDMVDDVVVGEPDGSTRAF